MTTQKWRSVTHHSPCPACGKPDWCAWSESGWLKCHRSDVAPSGFVPVPTKSRGVIFKPHEDVQHATGARPVRRPSQPCIFTNMEEAISAVERARKVKSIGRWVYDDAAGKPTLAVIRLPRPSHPGDGPGAKPRKEFRPVSRVDGGWIIGDPPGPLPLYHLPELLAATPSTPVIVTEGEKACECARSMGFIATTSPHGSQAAAKADWGPTAGRDLIVLVDHDDDGETYGRDVTRLAIDAGAKSVRVVRLSDLWSAMPTGGDVVDFLEHRQHESARAKAEIEALAATAKVVTRASLPVDGDPVLVCLASVQPTAVQWVWKGRIPRGRITLLAGRPGDGKSFVTMEWAARITTGSPWPDGTPCPQGSVIIVAGEDDLADTVRPRLDAHGADLRLVHALPGITRVSATGKTTEVAFTLEDIDALERTLAKVPDCAMVVIDPIGSFLGGRVDAHRDNQVRAVLSPLVALAQRTNVAVLLVAHVRKAEAAFADDLVLGSRAFTGIARSVLHLLVDPEDDERRLLLPGKSNLRRSAPGLAFTIEGEPGKIVWEPDEVNITANEVLARHARPERYSKVDQAGKWLLDYLVDGPRLATEVITAAIQAGHKERTVIRARDSVKVICRKAGFDDGWVWEHPTAAKGDLTPLEGCQQTPFGNLRTERGVSQGKFTKIAKKSDLATFADGNGEVGAA